MELWVRSQDKEKITKVNSVNVLGFADKITIHGYIDDRNHFWLGNYKTKERALEVLDEIQNILKPKAVVKVIDTSVKIDDDLVYRPQQNMEIQKLSTYVYEMPIE